MRDMFTAVINTVYRGLGFGNPEGDNPEEENPQTIKRRY